MREYCCEEFKNQTVCDPPQFERDEDGKTWNVNGCCGGGCFVVMGMKFCPYCGTELAGPKIVAE
jgi:hypothetical protein